MKKLIGLIILTLLLSSCKKEETTVAQCKDGLPGLTGPQGEPGKPGKDGLPGVPGPAGQNGWGSKIDYEITLENYCYNVNGLYAYRKGDSVYLSSVLNCGSSLTNLKRNNNEVFYYDNRLYVRENKKSAAVVVTIDFN